MTSQEAREQFNAGYRAGLLAAVEECEKYAIATVDPEVEQALAHVAVRITLRSGKDKKK